MARQYLRHAGAELTGAPRSHAGPEAGRPFFLGPRAACSCPVKTQNRFDETVQLPDGAPGAVQDAADGAGAPDRSSTAFAEQVCALLAAQPGTRDLRQLASSDLPTRARATAEAVASSAPIILAPALLADAPGHRRGSPDLLVLGPAREDGSPGYLPVLVRRHRMLEAGGGEQFQRCTPLGHGMTRRQLPGVRVRARREPDLLQLAHHWRILQAAGWASASPRGGVIGIDRASQDDGLWRLRKHSRGGLPPVGETMISWVDLTARQLRTYARSAERGWRLHSALERYDHEFAFRLHIAKVAMERHGSPEDPPPTVNPVVVGECESCRWWPACRHRLDPEDLSLQIDKARLDPREISVLRSMGITTTRQLATTDLEALLPEYLPEVQHRPGAEDRVRLAARRAGLLAHGQQLQRIISGHIELPEPGWSLDLDIETSVRDRVYLWGFLVDDPDDPDGPHYVHFSRFTLLDRAEEQELAEEAMTWLVHCLENHPQARVYHYSDFEVVHIRRIAAAGRLPNTLRVAHEFTRSNFSDLFGVVKRNIFGAHGVGLKAVAQYGAGFHWRDAEPGGLNSQHWFAAAVNATDEAQREALRRRLLEYNEDDTRATWALRGWLRGLS